MTDRDARDYRLRVEAPAGPARLDRFLAAALPEISRSRLKQLIEAGRVAVGGATIAEPSYRVKPGQTVELSVPPAAEAGRPQAEAVALNVIYEDADLIVVDKPPGLVVHPAAGNWSGTLLNGLLAYDARQGSLPRAGIVHRLDAGTSGLLVVARTAAAQLDLVRQLQARTVSRHYYALVHGAPPDAGVIDVPIGRHPTVRTRMAVVGNGRPAITRYRVRARLPRASLVECRLETGRTHQIRVHLAHLGHPLVGDPVYGLRRSGNPLFDDFSRQALHAFRLALIHPLSGEEISWQLPMAVDLGALLAASGIDLSS